jgi:hypothetical protein
MSDSKQNPSPPDDDDDSQKWDMLAQLLGAKPPAPETWERPRSVPAEPAESPRRDKGPGQASSKSTELSKEPEETEGTHWSSLAGNLGISHGHEETLAPRVAAVEPPSAHSSVGPSAAAPSNIPTSRTTPAAKVPNLPPAVREYVSAWDMEDEPAKDERIVNPFTNDPKPSLDPATTILSNLFGPSNSRLAGDPELENPSSTIRQVDDVEPIDEVRFEKFEGSFGDFEDVDPDISAAPRATGEESGTAERGERRGRRRGRGRGRGRDRDTRDRENPPREKKPRDSERAEAPRRPSRTQNRPETPRDAEFVADDEFDSFGPASFDEHDVEPTTWSGATPVDELDELDEFDDAIPEVPPPRSRRDEEDDYEVAPERGRRLKHPKLPSWNETVGMIVDRNLSQRSQSSGGNSSGGGNFRRRRGPRRRPSR